MKCKTCGFKNQADAELCARCGAVLEETPPVEEHAHFERSAPEYLEKKRKKHKDTLEDVHGEDASTHFERDVPDYMERKRRVGKK